MQPKAMNLIYVHTHDSGRYMQPYGTATDNPALMRLARESFMFHQAHCVAPTCSPSRTGMLSGMAPHSSGMFGLAHRSFHMQDFSKHLSHFLRDRGYHTVLSGVQHEAIVPELLGYDEIYAPKERADSRKSDLTALSHVREFLHRSQKNGKPFFLSFGMRSTHLAYEEAKNMEEDFVAPPFPVVNNRDTRHDFSNYLQSLKTADECLGVLLDDIDSLNLRDNTILLFTTDHGIAFPNMKCTLKDTGTGVALFLRHPEIGRGSSDALVSHIDIFPTICDMLGLEKPDYLQGKSLLPLMLGLEDKVHDYIFSEITYHAAYEPMRSVRTNRLKLIRRFSGDLRRPLSNIDDHVSKDLFLSSPLSRLETERDCLYDLIADPAEEINVAAFPEYREEYMRLRAVLEHWMKETGDPLLHGDIELQSGQIANKRSALSPSEQTYDCTGSPVDAKELLHETPRNFLGQISGFSQ